MAFINKLGSFFLGAVPISIPTGVWETIMMWFSSGITNYGWAIIVFTLALKLIMSPLDFFNKKTTEKNSKVQAIIQPEVAKIQKQYGNNKQMVNQKTMEIYKKYNYNVTGSCLVMVINLALTLFIFITLFAGLNSMASYKVGYQYQEMEKTYIEYSTSTGYYDYLTEYDSVYSSEIASYITGEETIADVTNEEKALAAAAAKLAAETLVAPEEELLEEINAAVIARYNEVKDSWLWVSNVWKSDTPWTKSNLTFDEYVRMAGITYKADATDDEVTFKLRKESEKSADQITYENVIASIESEDKVNGYLIIPILAVALTVLSMLASQNKIRFTKKKKEQTDTPAPKMPGGWVMVILLGGIMGYITISYNSVFALYILVGSLFSFATMPLMNLVIKKVNELQEKNKEKKNKTKTNYKR